MTEEEKVQPTDSPVDQADRTQTGETTDQGSSPAIETSHEARNMAMLCHILGAVGFFGPLVIWLSEKDKHRFVHEHGLAAINYQISLMIYAAVLGATIVLAFLLPVLALVHIVLIVIGAVKAHRGQAWRYPIAIPFLK